MGEPLVTEPLCQHEYVNVGVWQADDGEELPLYACKLCAEFAPPPWQWLEQVMRRLRDG